MSTQELALAKLIASGIQGTIHWTRKNTRVRLENGRYIDLGKRSYAAALHVAKQLGYFITRGVGT